MNKSKKIISIVAAATLAFSTLALSACGNKDYAGEELTAGYVSDAAVSSNGGFLVEKGDYVYFINGKEESTADNSYGDVVKGALMRISKAQLAEGKYDAAQIVVPSLFVAGDYDSGIYIYGDYVYYATPTTDKNKDGDVDNASLDFKRAKLDGTEAPMGGKDNYFFRLTSNTAKYRYVQEKGVVYCLYEEESKLKSYNTETGVTTVLVSGASGFFYDKEDATNPNVYYVMSVTPDLDKGKNQAASYNQIYCVNAANTVEVNTSAASYTAKDVDGNAIASYDFDESFLEEQNKKAKEESKKNKTEYEAVYDLNDYTTYPYVNLGDLVLDGVGKSGNVSGDNRFNADASSIADSTETDGYTYTLQQQANGGIYFTRTAVIKTGNTETAQLYYLPHARTEWNSITGNRAVTVVSTNTTAASATALYEIDENGVHSYIYLSDSILKRDTMVNGELQTVSMAWGVATDITLWKTEGEYLYYYGAGTNGKSLSRISYVGTKDDYAWNFNDEAKYEPETLSVVDFNDSWYKPELVTIGDKQLVLFASAKAYGAGSLSYNYIQAASLNDVAATNEAIEAINEEISKGSTEAQAVMKYYYQTGSDALYQEVLDLYNKNKQEEVTDFIKKFTEGTFNYESAYVKTVGRINEADAEQMEEDWRASLLSEEEEEDEGGLPTWAIVLIVCGSVLVVAAGVTIPTVIVVSKKKAKKRREEAIVSAYKHKKLDTTDDKSIDVYADEEPAESAETAEEAPVEEASEEEEAPVEESVETPVEE